MIFTDEIHKIAERFLGFSWQVTGNCARYGINVVELGTAITTAVDLMKSARARALEEAAVGIERQLMSKWKELGVTGDAAGIVVEESARVIRALVRTE